MAIFDDKTMLAVEKMNKETIKAAEFEKEGLVLQFKSVKKEKSQYGAEEDSKIVERGILEEGEQFTFVFTDKDGDTRRHYSKSMPFFIGMQQVEINEDDWVHIRREGVKDKTRYYVEVIGGPVSTKKPANDSEINSLDESSPF